MEKGVERISSHEFANLLGFTASQIRQDLNCFGGFGQQGYGYNVAVLHHEIGRILSLDQGFPAILIGAGNLGRALVRHLQFDQRGFQLVGLFDSSPDVIGRTVQEWPVLDIAAIEDFCHTHKPIAAILCVPDESAGEVMRRLVELGIKACWNFTHHDFSMQYKDQVVVENVYLGDSLMTLSFLLSEFLEK